MEQGEQGRILVVDDEEPVGKVLQQWLSRKGYHVRHALNFKGVTEAFAEEEFDLVTLDIMMPEVDGLEVLRWIREHFPDVGVVMATALGDLDSVLEAMRGGAINYLIKPFNMDLITAEIERGMERQRLIAENRSYQQELERMVAERTRQLQEANAQLRQAHGQLERQFEELRGRDRLVRFQMSMHSLEEAFAEVLEVLRQVLGVERAALYRPNAQGGALEMAAGMGDVEGLATEALDGDSIQARAFTGQRRVTGEEGGVAMPLRYREEGLGVVWLACAEGMDAEWLEVLERLCGEAALVLRGALVAEELDQGKLDLEMFSLDDLDESA